MENKIIYKDLKVHTGRIMHQHPTLRECWSMEIDGIGYGPKFTIEIIPKRCVFNSKEDCINEIDSDISHLERLKNRVIELEVTK